MKRIKVGANGESSHGLTPFPVELMLDSGAFGAWTRGQDIDVEDYIAFVREYGDLFDSVVNLDVIPGIFGSPKTPKQIEYSAAKSYENLQAMKEAGIPAVPVYHQGENIRWLERLVSDGEPYIGISPSGDSIAMNHGWFDEVFTAITDSQGRPYVKTHGFGVTAVPVLYKYPWYSFDSVTWVIKSGYGCIFVPREKKMGDGVTSFNYFDNPISVWVTGAPRKNDRYELEEQGSSLIQPHVWKFIEEEVGTTMHHLRYDPYIRMEAMARYYQNLSRLLVYKPFEKTGTFFPKSYDKDLPSWPMKKAIFAVGPTGNIRRSDILNRLGIRERLLSYFDLRDADPEEIIAYAQYGIVKPVAERRILKFKNWQREEYWNRRRIALAERVRERGSTPPYLDAKDEPCLEIIRKNLV